MRVWRSWRACGKRKSVNCATSMTCTLSTSAWTPAPRNSPPIPPTCTPPMKKSASPTRPLTAIKSWSSAAARTVSVRVSNLTTAAYTPRWRCAKTVTRPSWSTVTRKPSLPTTTLPTVCTSSRLPWKTCWKSCASRSQKALSCSTAGRLR